MTPRKIITIAVLILILAFTYLAVQGSSVLSDKEYSYLGGHTWYRSYDKALEVSKETGKPVMIYFWAIWCQFCEKYETGTLPDPRVKKILEEDFILLAVDLDDDIYNVAPKYGVSYPPATVFVDSNGKELARVPGYVPPENLLPTLQRVKQMET